MAQPRLIDERPESAAEKSLDEWFARQALAAPDNLEEAARLLIGLITGLYGLLFAVLAITEKKLPTYLSLPEVRCLGAAACILLWLCLLAALVVVLPFRSRAASGKLATQQAAFERLLRRKAAALWLAAAAFALGFTALAAALVLALLSA